MVALTAPALRLSERLTAIFLGPGSVKSMEDEEGPEGEVPSVCWIA
jgi:hypothetical protein